MASAQRRAKRDGGKITVGVKESNEGRHFTFLVSPDAMIKTVLEKWLKVIGEEEPLPGLTMDHLLPVFAHRILERLEKSLFQESINDGSTIAIYFKNYPPKFKNYRFQLASNLSRVPPTFMTLIADWLDGASLTRLYTCGAKWLNQILCEGGAVKRFMVHYEDAPLKPTFPKSVVHFTGLEWFKLSGFENEITEFDANLLPTTLKHLILDCSLEEYKDVGFLSLFPALETLVLPSLHHTITSYFMEGHSLQSTLQELSLMVNDKHAVWKAMPPRLVGLDLRFLPGTYTAEHFSAFPSTLESLTIRNPPKSNFWLPLLPKSLTKLTSDTYEDPPDTSRPYTSQELEYLANFPPELKYLRHPLFEFTNEIAEHLPRTLEKLDLRRSRNFARFTLDLDALAALPPSLTAFYLPRPEPLLPFITNSNAFLEAWPQKVKELPFWFWGALPTDKRRGVLDNAQYQHLLRNYFTNMREARLYAPLLPDSIASLVPASIAAAPHTNLLTTLHIDCYRADFSLTNAVLPISLTELKLVNYRGGGIGRVLLRSKLPNLTDVNLGLATINSASVIRFLPPSVRALEVFRTQRLLTQNVSPESAEAIEEGHVQHYHFHSEYAQGEVELYPFSDDLIYDSSDDDEYADESYENYDEQPFELVSDPSIISHLRHLDYLNIAYMGQTFEPTPAFLDALPPTLTHLSIRHATIHLDTIFHLSHLTNLQHLTLGEPIGVFYLEHALALPRSLTELDVRSPEDAPRHQPAYALPSYSSFNQDTWKHFPRNLTSLSLPVTDNADYDDEEDDEEIKSLFPFLHLILFGRYADDDDDDEEEEEDGMPDIDPVMLQQLLANPQVGPQLAQLFAQFQGRRDEDSDSDLDVDNDDLNFGGAD